jgi:hypothetical protein
MVIYNKILLLGEYLDTALSQLLSTEVRSQFIIKLISKEREGESKEKRKERGEEMRTERSREQSRGLGEQ